MKRICSGCGLELDDIDLKFIGIYERCPFCNEIHEISDKIEGKI